VIHTKSVHFNKQRLKNKMLQEGFTTNRWGKKNREIRSGKLIASELNTKEYGASIGLHQLVDIYVADNQFHFQPWHEGQKFELERFMNHALTQDVLKLHAVKPESVTGDTKTSDYVTAQEVYDFITVVNTRWNVGLLPDQPVNQSQLVPRFNGKSELPLMKNNDESFPFTLLNLSQGF
jgi:hypothetical protein